MHIISMIRTEIKYTIVTICYNERHKIAKTIESVIRQTYSNLEYLIIDGASNDGTLEIINNYAQKDKRIRVISEPDDGIYNAMNKAITLAKGDYINFMNAGDSFIEKNILDAVAKILKKRYPDILCGRANEVESDILYNLTDDFEKSKKAVETVRIEKINRSLFKRTLLGNWGWHQAIFAKTSIMRQYYFNEKYEIAADYDWFIRNIKAGRNIEYAKIVVCNFIKDGVSSRAENSAILKKELDDIIKEHYGSIMLYLKNMIKFHRHLVKSRKNKKVDKMA